MHNYKFNKTSSSMYRKNDVMACESIATNVNILFRKKTTLSFLVWGVILSTIATLLFGSYNFGGFTIKGYAWLAPMALAIFSMMKRKIYNISILKIWGPWIIVVILYQILSVNQLDSLQYTLMLICPIVVGGSASNEFITVKQLNAFYFILKFIVIVFLLATLFNTGLIMTGKLQSHGSNAADVMAATLFCTIFAAHYALVNKSALMWWVLSAIIPVLALTRMAIAVTLSTLPLSFAPVKLKTRIVLSAIILIFSLGLFYTDRVQHRMFYSGHGEISDLFWDNKDLKTNARKFMWKQMDHQIQREVWFGHGANASRKFISSITMGTLEHPHNDWRRFLFDYGLFGTTIFFSCAIAQIWHLIIKGRKSVLKNNQVLFFGGAATFLCMLFFMNTDNVVLYAAFFGNMQFIIIGLAYSGVREKYT